MYIKLTQETRVIYTRVTNHLILFTFYNTVLHSAACDM